ncbi:MAG: S1 RNA-binding domain-containing protein [Planctomycetaceae bacterium]|nr:MAG: S1 RNA-binding domain-containing protein [Planctomycetaceae bacterium]
MAQGQSQSAHKPASPTVGSTPAGKVGASAKAPPAHDNAADASEKATTDSPAQRRADSAQPAAATDESAKAPTQPAKRSVPNVRHPLAGDLQAELERELAAAAELEAFLGGAAGLPPRRDPLEDGQRVHGTVLKTDDDGVFVSLGGPDQGVIPREQCPEEPPAPGSSIEVIIRGLNVADSLYQLSIPGEAIAVTDWSDIEPGAIVEATITAANSGGLECTVAGIRGFMPISQISEHRVEDATDFVGQKLTCVVTESNPRRGNLVVSHRAILEREREQRRQEQLESISVGDLLEGIVRTVKDFGAFVDLGGLEGLIHISKLSWDRIKHPSEVIEVGQKVKVKVDKLDPQTGKISLSYRDLLENPWDVAADTVMPGAVLNGTVTRIAAFGAFVRIAAGVEGLVHISEIAGHRVTNVGSFLNEGQEIQVKVLSMDRDAQKISLSIKQAVLKAAEDQAGDSAQEEEIEVREPAVKATHQGPLRGGNNRPSGGEKFGLRW